MAPRGCVRKPPRYASARMSSQNGSSWLEYAIVTLVGQMLLPPPESVCRNDVARSCRVEDSKAHARHLFASKTSADNQFCRHPAAVILLQVGHPT